jgi:basic membrane protein A and related proteins
MSRARYVRWALALAGVGALIAAGATGVGAAKSTKTITMAFLYNGPKNDGGWSQSHDEARRAMEKALGGSVKTIFVESVPYGKQASDLWNQLVARKVNAIVDDTAAGPPFVAFCKQHLDVACATAYPPLPNQPKNLTNFYVAHWLGSYLSGIAAGMVTKKGTLGYVAPFKVPTVNASLNAFALGCQSVRPNCSVKTVLVNSWYNPPKEHDAAQTLLNAGVDVMDGLTDDPAYVTLAGKKNVWAVGSYQGHQAAAGKRYMTGVVWDWTKLYINYARGLLSGTWKNRPVVADLGGGAGITRWGPDVPANVKAAVAKVEAQMKAGKNVFTGPIYDNKGKLRVKEGQSLPQSFLLNGWTWLVKGVVSS